MPHPHRLHQADDAALARREARLLQRSHSALFETIPVPVTKLAEALGLRVEKRPELLHRARLEFLDEGDARSATIAIQTGLKQEVGRFAVAHEIGHAILLTRYPEAAREWDVGRREIFANIFASELLASPAVRARMAVTFRELTDPLGLLRLASRLGLTPGALLTLATQEASWIRDLDKIWLRVKYVGNAFTGRDAKLRIVSAHYDHDRFFIPTNQGLIRLAGEEGWLSCLPTGAVTHHRGAITVKLKRPAPAVPKFVTKRVPAALSAVRLQPSAADSAAYLIVLADLHAAPPGA